MSNLIRIRKEYKRTNSQREITDWFGNLILKSPAKNRLGLVKADDWLFLTDVKLKWLERQVSQKTMNELINKWKNLESNKKPSESNKKPIEPNKKPIESNKKPIEPLVLIARLMLAENEQSSNDRVMVAKVLINRMVTVLSGKCTPSTWNAKEPTFTSLITAKYQFSPWGDKRIFLPRTDEQIQQAIDEFMTALNPVKVKQICVFEYFKKYRGNPDQETLNKLLNATGFRTPKAPTETSLTDRVDLKYHCYETFKIIKETFKEGEIHESHERYLDELKRLAGVKVNKNVSLLNIYKYYDELPHQVKAVEWLGSKLLITPVKEKFNLKTKTDWIEKLDNSQLLWLERQISPETMGRFTKLWRTKEESNIEPKKFIQRDNKINPSISCNSTAHAILVDYHLRKAGKKGLDTDDDFVSRVYSGKYGRYGRNNSASWDIVHRVCNSYGVKVKYSNKGFNSLLKEIDKNGISCANIFHKGTSFNSRSGGHVITIVGHDDRYLYIHDPWGSTPQNGYKDRYNGVYKMLKSEFQWRFQGIHTELEKVK